MIKIFLFALVASFSISCIGKGRGNKNIGTDPEVAVKPSDCDDRKASLQLMDGRTATRESIYQMVLENRENLKALDVEKTRFLWACHEAMKNL